MNLLNTPKIRRGQLKLAIFFFVVGAKYLVKKFVQLEAIVQVPLLHI